MRPVLLSLLLLLPSFLFADVALEVAGSGEGRAIFADLLRGGWNGLRETESAAFIILDEHGRYQCVEWPYTGERRRQTYRGTPPPFTVAIAHTHPKSMRRPSPGDLLTAATLGVPVFVLTPTAIIAAMPDGSTLPIVLARDWAREVAARGACRGGAPALALAAE